MKRGSKSIHYSSRLQLAREEDKAQDLLLFENLVVDYFIFLPFILRPNFGKCCKSLGLTCQRGRWVWQPLLYKETENVNRKCQRFIWSILSYCGVLSFHKLCFNFQTAYCGHKNSQPNIKILPVKTNLLPLSRHHH